MLEESGGEEMEKKGRGGGKKKETPLSQNSSTSRTAATRVAQNMIKSSNCVLKLFAKWSD
jgi:hypothetical protein